MELQYTIVDGYDTDEPRRGTEHSAGLDVYIPRFTPKFLEDLKEKNKTQARIHYSDTTDVRFQLLTNGEREQLEVNKPDDLYVMGHGRVIIPTGLRFNIPTGTYLEVANRGSTAALQGLIFGAHIIDEDYQGIVFINLINTTSNTIYLKAGTKLVQLIHKKWIKSALRRVPENELYPEVSKRGEGALGHTGQ
jgi:dUTPase